MFWAMSEGGGTGLMVLVVNVGNFVFLERFIAFTWAFEWRLAVST